MNPLYGQLQVQMVPTAPLNETEGINIFHCPHLRADHKYTRSYIMHTDLEHNYEDADHNLLETKQGMDHMDYEVNPAYTVHAQG